MALIHCEGCGKEISDQAGVCPNCGYNIKKHLKEVDKSSPEGLAETEKRKKLIPICVVAILVVGIFLIINTSVQTKAANDEKAYRELRQQIDGNSTTLKSKYSLLYKGMTLYDAVNTLKCNYYTLDNVSNNKITYYVFTDGTNEVYLDVDTQTKKVTRIEYKGK